MNDDIKISDEARECGEKEIQAFLKAKEDEDIPVGVYIQLLLNKRDELIRGLCESHRIRVSNLHQIILERNAVIDQRDAEISELRKDYNELIMAVARKFENETRHQTALRYINQAEQRECGTAMSNETKGEQK